MKKTAATVLWVLGIVLRFCFGTALATVLIAIVAGIVSTAVYCVYAFGWWLMHGLPTISHGSWQLSIGAGSIILLTVFCFCVCVFHGKELAQWVEDNRHHKSDQKPPLQF
jgi:hypothetical protein